MKFDKAVSLGINCQSRYHISRTVYRRRHKTERGFNIGEHARKEIGDYGTYFFDWSVTPINGLIQTLQGDFDGVLQKQNLVIKRINHHKQTVIDSFTDLRYPHTFPHARTGILTEQIFDAQYPMVKKKFEYLVAKTMRLWTANENILFVRCGSMEDDDLHRLLNILGNKLPHFKLMYLPWTNKACVKNDAAILQNPQIIYRPVVWQPYPGDSESWNEAFRDIALQLP